MRVSAYLSDHRVPFETLWHPPAYTACNRAKVLGLPGRAMAKSVLLALRDRYIVAVLPATHRVDLHSVGDHLGQEVRLAAKAEIADVFGDCEWGSLAPFGRLYGVTTLRDEMFDPQADIVFESQRHFHAIRMRCADFDRLEAPRRFYFSRPDKEPETGESADTNIATDFSRM